MFTKGLLGPCLEVLLYFFHDTRMSVNRHGIGMKCLPVKAIDFVDDPQWFCFQGFVIRIQKGELCKNVR